MYSRGFAFYTPHLSVSSRAALLAAADAAGTTCLASATLLRTPDAEWEALMDQDLSMELVQEGGSVEDCWDLRVSGRPIVVSFAMSADLIALTDAIAASLPADVIGDLGWAGFYAVVGPHYIIDFGNYEKEPTRIAVAQFSFGLASTASPNNRRRLEELLYRTAAVRTLQHELERAIGPLQRWASF